MKTTCTRDQALRFLEVQVESSPTNCYWADVLGYRIVPGPKQAAEILENAGARKADPVLGPGRKVEDGLVLLADWLRAIADQLDPRLLAGGRE